MAEETAVEMLGNVVSVASITLKMAAKDRSRLWDLKRYQQPGETMEDVVADLKHTDDLMQKTFGK